MKKIFLIITGILLVGAARAQMNEGKIIYERKINLHKRLPPDQENMKNMIPQFNISKAELLFAENESIYKNVQEDQDIRETAGEGDNGNRIFMRFGGADDETYKNYATRKSIEQRELGPRKYIIEDSFRAINWKLDETGGTKTIKGYECKKAVGKTPHGANAIAWYTEQISCPGGPDIFGGLPGMILEVNINEDEIVYTPVDIISKMDKKLVKAPSNGKKITRKDFQKMMEEQFGAEGGKPVIRIQRFGGD